MELTPEVVSLGIYCATTSIGAAVYVAKLATRVAVLEAVHEVIGSDLSKIKRDLELLLEFMYSNRMKGNSRKP